MAQNKRYHKEFKLQAARLVTEQGYSLRDAAERLAFRHGQSDIGLKSFSNLLNCRRKIRFSRP